MALAALRPFSRRQTGTLDFNIHNADRHAEVVSTLNARIEEMELSESLAPNEADEHAASISSHLNGATNMIAEASQAITQSDSGATVNMRARFTLYSRDVAKTYNQLKNNLSRAQNKFEAKLIAAEISPNSDEYKEAARKHKDACTQILSDFSNYVALQKRMLIYAMTEHKSGVHAQAKARLNAMIKQPDWEAITEGQESELGEGIVAGEGGVVNPDYSKLTSFTNSASGKTYSVEDGGGRLTFNTKAKTEKQRSAVVQDILAYAEVQGWETLNYIDIKDNPMLAFELYLTACERGMISDERANAEIFQPQDPTMAATYQKVIAEGEKLRAAYKQRQEMDPAMSTESGLDEKFEQEFVSEFSTKQDREFFRDDRNNMNYRREFAEHMQRCRNQQEQFSEGVSAEAEEPSSSEDLGMR